MIIKDNISGEILSINDRTDALREAKSRISYHNSEFNYSHRGKHYPQNAEMIVDNDTITIQRKETK